MFGTAAATDVQVSSDGNSLTASTPAGTKGAVTVSVATPAGSASLPNGFSYVNEVHIASLEPSRIPANTESTLVIRGSGFIAPPSVRLAQGDVSVSAQVNLAASTTSAITATVPALDLGSYSVTVTNGDNEVGTSPVNLEVAEGIRVTEVDPNAGFADETTRIRITGSGFDGVTSVLIGNAPCTDMALDSDTILCTVPVGAAGPADVTVRRSPGDEAKLTGGFTYYSATDATVRVLYASPRQGRVTGGQTTEIAATGLGNGTPSVTLGGNSAAVLEVLEGKRVRVTIPPYSISGNAVSERVAITLAVGGSTDTKQNSFTFFVRPAIASFQPAKGATVGGDAITIFGAGFTQEDLKVSFDGVYATEVTYLQATSLSCKVPAHAAGFADVVVTSEYDTSETASDGFEFVEAVRITGIDPPAVSMAGGTIVMLTGSGFVGVGDRMRLTIDGTEVTGFQVLSTSSMRVVVPRRSAAGQVQVKVEDKSNNDPIIGSGTINLDYVDRTVTSGAATGGAIKRNISVSVVRQDTLARVSGVQVFLGDSYAQSSHRGTTDDNGMLVLAEDDLAGPLTITAALSGYENQTWVEVDAAEITFALYPLSPEQGQSPTVAQVSGTVGGWAAAGMPSGYAAGRVKRFAVVYTSEPGQGQASLHPGYFNLVSEEACDILPDNSATPLPQTYTVDAVVGQRMALLAAVYFYDSVDGVCSPSTTSTEGEGLLAVTAGAMGLLTDVVATAGTNPGYNITINRTVTVGMSASLVGAPSLGGSGSTYYTTDAILDLGESGVFTFYNGPKVNGTIQFNGALPAQALAVFPTGDVLNSITTLPTGVPTPGGDIKYVLGGVSWSAAEAGLPQSEAYQRSVQDLTVNINGFFAFPSSVAPANSTTLTDRTFSWAAFNQSASFVTVDIAAQDAQGNVTPTWSAILPSDKISFRLPDLTGAANVTDIGTGANLWQLNAYKIHDDEMFNYSDHSNDELGIPNWRAHVISEAYAFTAP
jgi:hypothetical protein